MTRIEYNGPRRGAIMLASEPAKAGIVATYEAPEERRGGSIEERAVHVLYFIADHAAGGGISAAGGLPVNAVVDIFKRDHPEVDAEVSDDDEQRAST